MYRRILLPLTLDHAESWTKALPEAVSLLRASGGELHLLTVVPDFGMNVVRDFFPADFEENVLRRAKADLEAFAETQVPGDVAFHVHLEHGSTAEHILDAAKRLDVDLIVMASRQPDRAKELLVGSNADRIVRRAHVSVLVTR